MLGYLIRRILAAIPVMGVVALFVFLLLRLTPGDPAAILAGDNATPAQLERARPTLRGDPGRVRAEGARGVLGRLEESLLPLLELV